MESAACVVVPVVSTGRGFFFDGADGRAGRPGVGCGVHSAAVALCARLRFSLLNMASPGVGSRRLLSEPEGRVCSPRAKIRKFTCVLPAYINTYIL
jgi:hypothetical protein